MSCIDVRGPRGQPYIKQMTAIMKFGLYVLCQNVAVEWPFGYRFGLAPVKARDENLPLGFLYLFILRQWNKHTVQ